LNSLLIFGYGTALVGLVLLVDLVHTRTLA